MLMVKPGIPYLDIVREVKDKVRTGNRDWEAAGEERRFVCGWQESCPPPTVGI